MLRSAAVYNDFLSRLPPGADRAPSRVAVPRAQLREGLRLLLPRPGAVGPGPGDADPRAVSCNGATRAATRGGAPASGSSSTPCTATAACGSPRSCAACGTGAATSRSSTASSADPVLQILRNGSGRGKVPMRQSGIKNGSGEIVKYNHSKWMTVTGRWGAVAVGLADLHRVGELGRCSPSAPTSRCSASRSRANALLYRGRSTRPGARRPRSAAGRPGGHLRARHRASRACPRTQPTWGKGAYRYMQP